MRILKVFLAFVLAFAKAFWCGKWRSLFRRFDRFEWAIKIDREPRDASNWSRCLKKATNCQFELVGVTNFVAQRGSEHEQSSEHFECYIWAGWFSRSSPSCEWWLFQDHSEPLKLWNLESEFQTLQSTVCFECRRKVSRILRSKVRKLSSIQWMPSWNHLQSAPDSSTMVYYQTADGHLIKIEIKRELRLQAL